MKVFLVFLEGNKIAGSAQKYRAGRVSGNTGILCRPYWLYREILSPNDCLSLKHEALNRRVIIKKS